MPAFIKRAQRFSLVEESVGGTVPGVTDVYHTVVNTSVNAQRSLWYAEKSCSFSQNIGNTYSDSLWFHSQNRVVSPL